MEFWGNFRNFPKEAYGAAMQFIIPGPWEFYLLEQLSQFGFKKSILAEGGFVFQRKNGGFEANPFSIKVIKTGQCKSFLIRQGGFKISGSAGMSGSDLNLWDTFLMAGNAVTIKFILNLGE